MLSNEQIKERVLNAIKGENKCEYSVDDFIRELKRVYHNDDNDYPYYVVDVFCNYNEIPLRNYNDLCVEFLDEEILKDEYFEEEEGPYGGAFSSWEDFWKWKEG